MTDKTYTKQELEEMTNALLAEDNKKKKAEAKAAEQSQAEAETKEDDKSKEKGKLDDKTIASLPAAALIMANEKLRDMLVKGKKKGKLDSSEVSDVLDEMDLESEQMDRIYDSLEALGIEVGSEEFITSIDDDIEPPLEEIAEIEEEELVDPNTLVDSFNIDDPVRMYLKEIGRVPLLNADEEVVLATAMSAGRAAQERIDEAAENGETIPDEELAQLKKDIKEGSKAKQKLADAQSEEKQYRDHLANVENEADALKKQAMESARQAAAEQLRRQIKGYLDEAAKAQAEASELKREVFRLQQRLDSRK